MIIEEIKNNVKEMISVTQGISNPNVDQLLEDWVIQKANFIQIFGGEPIWEYPKPVAFELGAKEKNLRIDDFISMIENKWNNSDLADFIYEERQGFFTNKIVKDYIYNDIKIIKGMKLLKSIKFFVKDEVVLNEIQTAASMIIQEDKIEGTLCLSVHPLDFLTSSDNDCNWRTCHSLNNGDYRSGNLSYMVDNATIMCYIKEKDDKIINGVLWNSKKWRVLLYFSEDRNICFAGRQYPFATSTGLSWVKDNVLNNIFHKNYENWTQSLVNSVELIDINDSTNSTQIDLNNSYFPYNGKLWNYNEVIVDRPGSLMFNDLLSSTCYKPTYTFNKVRFLHSHSNVPRIAIGGTVKCCHCGKNNLTLSESMLCESCELEYGTEINDYISCCERCGSRYYTDDGCYLDEYDMEICPQCMEEMTRCDVCGELFFDEDLYDYDDLKMCKYCFEVKEDE